MIARITTPVYRSLHNGASYRLGCASQAAHRRWFGTLGRVDLELLPDGSALATWIEFANQRAQFRARRIERSGTRSTPVTVAGIAGSRSSGYPRAAVANGEVVFAWTEAGDGGGLQLRTASASLPAQARK